MLQNFKNEISQNDGNTKLNNEDWSTSNDKKMTNNHVNELRPTKEVPVEYQSIFSDYAYFNVIQSTVIDTALYTDKSMVVSAPTGSGKTVIFELAIIRYLMNLKNCIQSKSFKIVYIAPMKALCEERLNDWHRKFASFGITIICVTGDSDQADVHSLLHHDLIISTPEKWDSITRRWQDNQKFAFSVNLFMVDEVHLLHEENRGPTLEVVISRMKTMQNLKPSHKSVEYPESRIRFVAVSATIPNAEDIAMWLSLPSCPAQAFMFGEETRPVPLNKIVLGYHYDMKNSTTFKFEIVLNYKLQSIIMQYAEGKPTLIFCSTRKSAEMTSQHITQNVTINLNPQQKQILLNTTISLSESKLKTMLVNGVCYHHAGLAQSDRTSIETLFRNGNLPILVTTSTLAMGVNLPAHLVIVKSTKYYCNGQYQDYSECMLQQMIGRAGRPQFDTSATAVILTSLSDKPKFENMFSGNQKVESNLHKHLAEHVNSEIVLRTITDLGVAMEWLSSTFLHIRARQNPRFYGLSSDLNPDQIDKKLLDICQIEINRLARAGMITIDQNDVLISPTMTGCLMAKYCVAFETMQLFTQVSGTEILQQVLSLIVKCREFSDIYLRVNDKKTLNLLNKCRNGETIRFPFNGKITNVDMKINCIIQAVFGCLEIGEQSLITESTKIMRIGERISKCLTEYLQTKSNCYSALLSALILAKCFHTRLWENSPYLSKQLSGIGNVYSAALVEAKKTSFQDLLDSNPRDLERLIHRKPPMGNAVQEEIKHLPHYELGFEKTINNNQIVFNLKIILLNAELLKSSSTINIYSFINLLMGDTANNIFVYEKYTHNYFIENSEVIKSVNLPIGYQEKITAHLISEDWVGIDKEIDSNFCDTKSVEKNIVEKMPTSKNINAKRMILGEKTKKVENKKVEKKKDSRVQTFINAYFGKSKSVTRKSNQVQRNKKLKRSGSNSTLPITVFAVPTIDSLNSINKDNFHIISNTKINNNVDKSNCASFKKKDFNVDTQLSLQELVDDSILQYTTQISENDSQNIIKKTNLTNRDPALTKNQNKEINVPKTPYFNKKSITTETSSSFKKFKLMSNIENVQGSNLMNNSKDVLLPSQFKYQPRSVLHVENKVSIEEFSATNQIKGPKKNDHRSITWSSPLILSPPVKHSPPKSSNKLHDDTINIFLNDLTNSSCSDLSVAQFNELEKVGNSKNLHKSLICKSQSRSTLHQNLYKRKKHILPLSDEACSQVETSAILENENCDLEVNKDDSLVSPSYMEIILNNNEQNCLSNDVSTSSIKSENQEKLKLKKPLAVTQYYSQLMLNATKNVQEEERIVKVEQNNVSFDSTAITSIAAPAKNQNKISNAIKTNNADEDGKSSKNNTSTEDLFDLSDMDYFNETNMFETNSQRNFLSRNFSPVTHNFFKTNPPSNKENTISSQSNRYPTTTTVPSSQYQNHNPIQVEKINSSTRNYFQDFNNQHAQAWPTDYSPLFPCNEIEIAHNISQNFHSQPVVHNNCFHSLNNGIEHLRPASQIAHSNYAMSNQLLAQRHFEQYGRLPTTNINPYPHIVNLPQDFCSSSRRHTPQFIPNGMRYDQYVYQNDLECMPCSQNPQEYSRNFVQIRYNHHEQYQPNYYNVYDGGRGSGRNDYDRGGYSNSENI